MASRVIVRMAGDPPCPLGRNCNSGSCMLGNRFVNFPSHFLGRVGLWCLDVLVPFGPFLGRGKTTGTGTLLSFPPKQQQRQKQNENADDHSKNRKKTNNDNISINEDHSRTTPCIKL